MLDSIVAAGGSRFSVNIITDDDEIIEYDLTITEKNLILNKRNGNDELMNIHYSLNYPEVLINYNDCTNFKLNMNTKINQKQISL